MRDIDFLPDRYRQRRAHRQVNLWRVLVFVVLGGAVFAAGFGQFFLERSAARALREVGPQHAAAAAQERCHRDLQERLVQARGAAELCAYLRGQWPRAEVLGALARACPPELALRELAISSEAVGAEAAPGGFRGEPAFGGETGGEPAGDLERLRREQARLRTVARVGGHASDPAAVHRFVSNIAHSPLFAKAELESLEANPAGPSQRGTRFQVRAWLAAAPAEELLFGADHTAEASW